MKKSFVFLMLFFIVSLHWINYGEIKIKYNEEKKVYEVWDEEKNILKNIIKDNLGKGDKKRIANNFPYQMGWPIEMPTAVISPISIDDIDNDLTSESAFVCWGDSHGLYLYSHLGLPEPTFNYLGIAFIPSFEDIDIDGLKEIIGFHRIENDLLLGIDAVDINSKQTNGFPNPPNVAFHSSAIEDLDRDGNMEIIFNQRNLDPWKYTIGLHVVGSYVGILPGFPVPFPFLNPYLPASPGFSNSSPSIGDFDDDGLLEIAINTANTKLYLIRSDGSHFRNWPLVGAFHLASMPTIADIDNDGKLELAITRTGDIEKVFVFNEDATILDGFPVGYGYLPAYIGPTIADINRDGNLELYLFVLCQWLIAFDNKGKILPGWPIPLKVNGVEVSFNSFPTIADIDGDGEMEIVGAGGTCELCPDGVIVAYNYDGTPVEGFPIFEEFYGFIGRGATVADLDNDGDIEICTGSERCDRSDRPAYFYCYDLPYSYNRTKVAWNNYAHDNQHTGRYVDPEIKPPTPTSINPNFDSYLGGRIVQIKGKNFMPGAKVFFDGIPSEYVQVVDSETIFAKVPPHKPCFISINDPSISPYELSERLIGQKVSQILNNNKYERIKFDNKNGCVVNVVVVHPSPDQREGVLRSAFTYTGYENLKDDIILFISKYAPMGTFENNGANWGWLTPGLWNIVDSSSGCLPMPFPSGSKAAYYGDKNKCNYNVGDRTYSYLETPYIKIDRADAKIRFKLFRDVEYNPMRNADELTITLVKTYEYHHLMIIDSTIPSEKKWVTVELNIGAWQGEEGVRIHFNFDSKDSVDNDHIGIAIDNVELIGAHWMPWSETAGEVILNWTGGLPKYFVYRGTNPDFVSNPPELRAYTPFRRKYENSLNDYQSYYYKVR